MTYDHVQRSPLHLILLGAAAVLCLGVLLMEDDAAASALVAAFVALPLFLTSLCFAHLRVRDDGDHLAVRFGPIALFGRRIRYSEITAVEAGRSSLWDGWGVHWMWGRGWIYNLWGFDCVVVHLGRKTIRIGTDDVPGLLGFLESRAGRPGSL